MALFGLGLSAGAELNDHGPRSLKVSMSIPRFLRSGWVFLITYAEASGVGFSRAVTASASRYSFCSSLSLLSLFLFFLVLIIIIIMIIIMIIIIIIIITIFIIINY